MKTEVRLKKGALNHFRKLARNSPNEIMALLIGEVVSSKLTVIDSFEYTRKYAESDPCTVSWYQHEQERVQKKAEARGRRVIGFIHSHPEWDAVMSSKDAEVLLYYGYRVCGIVSTQARKTRTRFWIMDSALPCEIKYVKKTKCSTVPDADKVSGRHPSKLEGDSENEDDGSQQAV